MSQLPSNAIADFMAVNPAISLPSLHPMNYYNLSDEVRGTVSWAKQIVCCGELVELYSISQVKHITVFSAVMIQTQ